MKDDIMTILSTVYMLKVLVAILINFGGIIFSHWSLLHTPM